MITIIIIINIARVLACVTCRRVVFRKKPTCIDSGMVFQITYIHYYTAKFAHMNGHWKAYDYCIHRVVYGISKFEISIK